MQFAWYSQDQLSNSYKQHLHLKKTYQGQKKNWNRSRFDRIMS